MFFSGSRVEWPGFSPSRRKAPPKHFHGQRPRQKERGHQWKRRLYIYLHHPPGHAGSRIKKVLTGIEPPVRKKGGKIERPGTGALVSSPIAYQAREVSYVYTSSHWHHASHRQRGAGRLRVQTSVINLSLPCASRSLKRRRSSVTSARTRRRVGRAAPPLLLSPCGATSSPAAPAAAAELKILEGGGLASSFAEARRDRQTQYRIAEPQMERRGFSRASFRRFLARLGAPGQNGQAGQLSRLTKTANLQAPAGSPRRQPVSRRWTRPGGVTAARVSSCLRGPVRSRLTSARQANIVRKKKVCSFFAERWTSSGRKYGADILSQVSSRARQDSPAPMTGVCSRHHVGSA